jgi:hypothetical protein
MAGLMNGAKPAIEPASNKAIKQANLKATEQESNGFHREEQESNKTIKLVKNKAIKQDSSKEIIEMKEKATFNLSLSILQVLEDTWLKLRRQLKGEQRITKTVLVELALEIAIEEFESQGSDSRLYKKLADLRSDSKLDGNCPS